MKSKKNADHFLFYADTIEKDVAYLDNEEGRHAMAVLRFCAGDQIRVTDGKGSVYECTIAEKSADRVSVTVHNALIVKKPETEINMYVGLCDKDKFEDLTEQCSALGARKITPLICRYCQNPWWQQWDKHSARIRKKLIAGIKQSHNPWLTQCESPIGFAEALCLDEKSFLLFADADGTPLLALSNRIVQSTAPAISCYIGPPGGFCDEEISSLQKFGIPVSLSAFRLRTELAAAVMCGTAAMMANANPRVV